MKNMRFCDDNTGGEMGRCESAVGIESNDNEKHRVKRRVLFTQ